jgi:hypothetical protein
MKKIANDPRRTLLTDAHVERNKIMKEKRVQAERLAKEKPSSAAEAHAQYDRIKAKSSRDRP